MENKDFPEIDEILERIRTSLKTELDSIKSEIKTDLKTELNTIKSDLKAEIDSIKSGAFPSPEAPPPSATHPPFDDSPEFEASDNESNKKTEEFTLSNFTGIHVGGAFEVEIIRSDSYNVTIMAEDALFRNLDVSKEGETLKVRHSKHISWRAQLTRPKARITMPVLKELHLSGATKAVISGFSSSEVFKLNLSGASSVNGEITSGNAEFELSGASRAKLTGSAKDAIIKASGANHMDLRGFSIRNAAVKLSGASRINTKIDGRLDARLSGVSHFSWIGNPIMGDIKTSGASTLSRE